MTELTPHESKRERSESAPANPAAGRRPVPGDVTPVHSDLPLALADRQRAPADVTLDLPDLTLAAFDRTPPPCDLAIGSIDSDRSLLGDHTPIRDPHLASAAKTCLALHTY